MKKFIIKLAKMFLKIIIISVISFVSIVLIFLSSIFIKNYIDVNSSKKFVKQLVNYGYNDKIKPIEYYSACGLLAGMGDYVQFFSMAIVECDEGLEYVKDNFNIENFEPAKKSGKGDLRLEVLPFSLEYVNKEYFSAEGPIVKTLMNYNNYTDIYMVILSDYNYPDVFQSDDYVIQEMF